MPAYDLPGSEKKVDGTGRPEVVKQYKMASSKTIKVRMMMEVEMSRQEVYDAIVSRFEDTGKPTETQMNAIWERLSERSLGYTDVSDVVWGEDEDDIYEKMRDGLADVLNDEGLLEEEDDWQAKIDATKKEIDQTNGWEEVYNAGNQTRGNPLGGERRENPRLPGQEGIFYQTYGNGGFAGRRDGGYWAMRVSSGQHLPGVYEVAGQEFTLLEGVALEFRPEHSWSGTVAAVRIVPMKLSQEPHLAEGVKALEAEAMTNLLRLRADRQLRVAAAV